MAKLTSDDVLKLARLARLKLSNEEVKQFCVEMSEILDHVEQLQAVDVGHEAPTYQVTGLKNVTRADKVIDYGMSKEMLLKNVPATENGHIKVKRVL